jgi:uncharacterized YigZ family protein
MTVYYRSILIVGIGFSSVAPATSIKTSLASTSARSIIIPRMMSSSSTGNDGSYTIADAIELTEVVKKSKFIARASPVSSIEEALEFIAKVSEPKASHNCWAYRSSSTPAYERFSDDGEPGGTAGRPILQAIEAEGIVDVAVCVTRYFGGTKLGTGGLVRAYGSAARNALKLANRKLVIPSTSLTFTAAVADLGAVYQVVNGLGNTVERRRHEDRNQDTIPIRRSTSSEVKIE